MQALFKLQQSFAADLWEEELNRLDAVVMDGRLPAERLFQVYRNNFWISAEDALAGIYKVIKRLVGAEFFSFMVNHFLRSYPPRYGNMIQLGSDLPVFLSDFKPVEELPYLADIARLELSYHQVFHAAETRPFNPQVMKEIPSEKIALLHFDMSSNSRLVYSPFPIFQIWSVNQDQYEGDQNVNLKSGSESVLITRPNLEVKLLKLDQVEARFLQYLIAGNNLGQATEAALLISKKFNLEAVLTKFLAAGTLTLTGTEPSESARTNKSVGGK